MSSIKKKGYLQGKLLKPVYQEKLKQEKKDPLLFCNRFAEEVGKECIKSQIDAVELEIAKLETAVREKENLIQELNRQKALRIQEIGGNYDDQIQQLKERKQVFLTMDREPMEQLMGVSTALDAKVDGVLALARKSQSDYNEQLTKLLQDFTAKSKRNLTENSVQQHYAEVKEKIDQKIAEEFAFPEVREVFKNMGLFGLFLVTLMFDFLLAYTVMADFFNVGTSRALNITLPFGIGMIPAEVSAALLTIMVTLILMLFFQFFQFKKEQIGDKEQYDRKTLLLYLLVGIFLLLWVYQSTTEGGKSNARNIELIFRILFIPAIFIGEVILQKIDRNVLFDLFKKIRLIPVKMMEYVGYILGKYKTSAVKKTEGGLKTLAIQQDYTQAQEGAENSDSKLFLQSLSDEVKKLQSVVATIFSSYEVGIKDYQDQLNTLEQNKQEAISKGTADYMQQINKIENADIAFLKKQIQQYRQKINERIQEASQGVLEGLTE